jgi:hypothetical protein
METAAPDDPAMTGEGSSDPDLPTPADTPSERGADRGREGTAHGSTDAASDEQYEPL